MSAMSDYLEEAFLKSLLNAIAFPSLPSLWLGLALATPFTDSSYASEVSGGGYSRQQLTAAFTIADAGGGQWQGQNTAAISIEATGDWGSPPTDKVEGCGLFDASSGGNLLAHGALVTPLPVYAGNIVYFAPSALTVEAQ